jgi:hypothetical protein
MNVGRIGRCRGRPHLPGGMMSCVIFNSAAPAGAGATRRGATAQEEKRSPTRTTPGNPNVRSFTIPGVAKRNRLKAARRELCRIIRYLGSAMQMGIRGGTRCPNALAISVEAAVSAANSNTRTRYACRYSRRAVGTPGSSEVCVEIWCCLRRSATKRFSGPLYDLRLRQAM